MSTTGADGLEICWNAEHGYAAGCECDLVGISRPATTKEWRSRAEQAEHSLQEEKFKLDGFVAYLQDRLNQTGRNANPFFADVVVDESCEKLSTWAHAIYAVQDETRLVYRREAEQAECEREISKASAFQLASSNEVLAQQLGEAEREREINKANALELADRNEVLTRQIGAAEQKLASYGSPCGQEGHVTNLNGYIGDASGKTLYCVTCEALARAEEADRLLDVLADHVVIEGFACLDDDIHEIACELDVDDTGLEKMYRPAMRELIRRFAVAVGTPAEPKGDTQ